MIAASAPCDPNAREVQLGPRTMKFACGLGATFGLWAATRKGGEPTRSAFTRSTRRFLKRPGRSTMHKQQRVEHGVGRRRCSVEGRQCERSTRSGTARVWQGLAAEDSIARRPLHCARSSALRLSALAVGSRVSECERAGTWRAGGGPFRVLVRSRFVGAYSPPAPRYWPDESCRLCRHVGSSFTSGSASAGARRVGTL